MCSAISVMASRRENEILLRPLLFRDGGRKMDRKKKKRSSLSKKADAAAVLQIFFLSKSKQTTSKNADLFSLFSLFHINEDGKENGICSSSHLFE